MSKKKTFNPNITTPPPAFLANKSKLHMSRKDREMAWKDILRQEKKK